MLASSVVTQILLVLIFMGTLLQTIMGDACCATGLVAGSDGTCSISCGAGQYYEGVNTCQDCPKNTATITGATNLDGC